MYSNDMAAAVAEDAGEVAVEAIFTTTIIND